MKTLVYRAFATELLKIATEISDGDVRKLLAERRGEEYLQGGKLPDSSDEEHHASLPKLGFSSMMATQLGASNPLGTAHKKKPGKYQETRDWALTGLKGATGGVAASGLAHALAGHPQMPTHRLRAAAALGTGIAVGDRMVRYHEEKKKKGPEKTAGIVNPSAGPFRSAGNALAAARKTGGFKSRVVHKLGKPPKVVQLGRKFQMPATPGV